MNISPPITMTQRKMLQGNPTDPVEFYSQKMGYDINLVRKVWNAAVKAKLSPTLALSVVSHESGFKTSAINVNKNGTNDWGLFQLNSKYHDQLRLDVDGHIQRGIQVLKDLVGRHGTLAGVAVYNVGNLRPEGEAARKTYMVAILKSAQRTSSIFEEYKKIDPKFLYSIWREDERSATLPRGEA